MTDQKIKDLIIKTLNVQEDRNGNLYIDLDDMIKNMKNKQPYNSLIDPEEIYYSADEDKWWKRGAYLLAIVFFGYFIARSIVTFIF